MMSVRRGGAFHVVGWACGMGTVVLAVSTPVPFFLWLVFWRMWAVLAQVIVFLWAFLQDIGLVPRNPKLLCNYIFENLCHQAFVMAAGTVIAYWVLDMCGVKSGISYPFLT
ncbi:hypothetical protein Pelo_16113 [Pelomyxa schiedti]|nr:hypothetical protein Pelo_16113 [Pelomyxa schiedti]